MDVHGCRETGIYFGFLPAILSTALSAGSSTDPPWIFRFERSCLGKFHGNVSPGAGDTDPDFTLYSSSSEKSADEDIEQRRDAFPDPELCVKRQ